MTVLLAARHETVKMLKEKGHDEESACAIAAAAEKLMASEGGGEWWVGADGAPRLGFVAALEGKGFNHPVYGKFDFTSKDLEQMAANFELLGRPVPVYFGHIPDDYRDSTPAAAFVIAMAHEGTHLGAVMEFSMDGWFQFAGNGFRGYSPEISWGVKDQKGKVVGTVHKAGAITNTPFLPLQLRLENGDPVDSRPLCFQLTNVPAVASDSQEDPPMKELLAALGATTEAEALVKVAALNDTAAKFKALEEEKAKLDVKLTDGEKQAGLVVKLEERLSKVEKEKGELVASLNARDIREALTLALSTGRLRPADVEGKDPKAMTDAEANAWLEQSWFGSLDKLVTFSTKGPVAVKLDGKVTSGTPNEDGGGEVKLSDKARAEIQAAGGDPEAVEKRLNEERKTKTAA